MRSRFLRVGQCLLLGIALSASGAGAAEHVVINEIHVDPPENKPLEFVELHNPGAQPVALGGWKLEKFVFPAEAIIAPGGFVVVARNPPALTKEFAIPAFGPLPGKLSNQGEKLTLTDRSGAVVDQVSYQLGFPWPSAAAEAGSSLERLHPLLDGNQPSSWRASGFSSEAPEPVRVLVSPGAEWRWRRGTSEASDPRNAWRLPGFVEDASWSSGKAGFGFGDNDDATLLADMAGHYASVFLRKKFTVNAPLPTALVVRARVDDGCIVWLNGREIARFHAPEGEPAYNSLAVDHEAGDWEEAVVPGGAPLLVPGENVLAVQGFNSALASSDFSLDVALQTPVASPGARSHRPTPGAANSVFTTHAPPACTFVRHLPQQPRAGEAVVVTAAFTGAQSALLQWQPVEPGAYLRGKDAEYSRRWAELPMHDDGRDGDAQSADGLWTATLPGEMQTHRRLIRYRISAKNTAGARVQLPYADDPCGNFAYFVSNGPAAYTGTPDAKTPPLVFSRAMQETLPTFTLLADAEDVRRSQWDGGANHQRFAGTLIYDGLVYDHIAFQNRGTASTYNAGKNKWGFHFLPTHELAMRDFWGRPYRAPWKNVSMNACASPWVQINRGMAGLDEAISFRCYRLAGLLASDTIPLGFRVVSGVNETGATPYDGDLWGLYLAVENINRVALENHALPNGLIAHPGRGIRHVPNGFSEDPAALWREWTEGPKGDPAAWWRTHFDLEAYYSIQAINRLVGNVDLRPGENHYLYRNAARGWAPVPWDLDMQFIPRTHQAGAIEAARCLEVPALRLEYQNRAREILDLLASDATPTGGQIGQLVAEYVRRIEPAGPNARDRSWAWLDACRWNFAPVTSDKGAFFRNPAEQGMSGGSFRRLLATPDFAGFAKYVLDYCTDSRPVKNYAINDGNPLGYGWGYLSIEAADANIPARPTASAVPGLARTFVTSAFTDPQGPQSFAAVQWRIAEIGTPAAAPGRYEITPIWQSAAFSTFAPQFTFAANLAQPGHAYRVRVRHQDSSGRWSHWSLPAQLAP